MNFERVLAISEIHDPLSWTEAKMRLMVDACRDMAIFHCEHSPDTRALYERKKFDPYSLQEEKDLARIPPIGVTAMKHYLMTSLPPEQAVLKLTSSGTRGQKTQIWFDEGSLHRVQRMIDVYLEQEKMLGKELTNYLVFTYDPHDAGDLGIAYTEKNQLRFAPCNEVFYAIKKDSAGQWVFKKEEALATLLRYEEMGMPVRIFGMPAFIYEFLQFMPAVRNVNLAPGSLMITGGGWKAAEAKQISRADFRAQCAERFGIPAEWLRDAYGMAEHCAPYFECREHRFHVAVYNRLFVRDPESMELVPDGERGLLELLTPFNAMMPTLALLSTDWAIIDRDPCGCGRKSPTFTLLGRAGLSKHKGCAIHADDIVARSRK